MFIPESSLNRRPSMLLILDHVLTTTSNDRPHLTTFFGDCFDGFNKSGNQLGFKTLMATNEITIIPAYHQSPSFRPRHKKSCDTRSSFCAYCLRLTGGLIPQPPWVGLRPPNLISLFVTEIVRHTPCRKEASYAILPMEPKREHGVGKVHTIWPFINQFLA